MSPPDDSQNQTSQECDEQNLVETNRMIRRRKMAARAKRGIVHTPSISANPDAPIVLPSADPIGDLARELATFNNLFRFAVLASLSGHATDLSREVAQPVTKKIRGKDVEAHMLKMLANGDHLTLLSWPSRKWAESIGCGESSVRETKTWKENLPRLREMSRKEAIENRGAYIPPDTVDDS